MLAEEHKSSQRKDSRLGRGLANAQPQSNRSEPDEWAVVSRKFVVTGCHTFSAHDLVEEPFEKISDPVKGTD